MSNSSLVSYTKISPNKSAPRNHAIDTITIHCVVGQCSVETLGEIFAPTSKEASSNYGVGYDGRIGMYVEEKDRSWCSSSSENDNRAITIEVASDTTEPYAVNSKAYAALIDLVTDICKRNGIKKLVWSTDKNQRMNHLNGCNMTVHRDYANKSCPGTYLYERHGDIAAKVNAKLGATETPTVEVKPYDVKLVGANDEEKIWNYLLSKIGNPYGVAGVMGNMYAESGLQPKNLQNAYESKLGMTDATYTAAVDNGSYTNFVHDSAGYGLVQWTYYSLKEELLNYAKSKKASIGSLDLQLEFICKQLSESYTAVWNVLKSATSVLEASNAMLLKFERPADQSAAVQTKRAGYGQTYLDKYAKIAAAPANNNFTAKKLIEIAVAQIGYHEKASNSNLDNNTANSGSNNWTKFARDLYEAGYYNGNKNGYAWCDVFVDWCFYQLAGKDAKKAQELECQTGPLGAGCTYSMKYYKEQGRFSKDPQVGDQIFFCYDGEPNCSDHTGIVETVSASQITTIEGNTSDQVARRTYSKANSNIVGYGHPKFSGETGVQPIPTPVPVVPTPQPAASYQVGDLVDFTGTIHYTNANAASGPSCTPGLAKVTAVSKSGKHPYHLIAEKNCGSNVYGWVNESDIKGKHITTVATTYPAVPFTVRVLIPDLNYRSAPSTEGKILGQTGKNVFTIVEVSNGWGKLKSGAGWIYLENSDYCTVMGVVNKPAPSVFQNYLVKVTASALNIRKGPGTNFAAVGQIKDQGVYTIVEESNGWGRLKSGAGWISLEYTKKC